MDRKSVRFLCGLLTHRGGGAIMSPSQNRHFFSAPSQVSFNKAKIFHDRISSHNFVINKMDTLRNRFQIKYSE